MRAFNCECESCGAKCDRIVKGNDIVKCSCDHVMTKIQGPIGGCDVLPLELNQPPRFVPYMSESLGRMINTEIEMKKVYDEMYGVKSVKVAAPVQKEPEAESEAPVEVKKRGRPKKVEIEEDEDDVDEDDDV